MANRYKNKGNWPDDIPEPATKSAPKPGDYPLGSLQSRAAARIMKERKKTEKIYFITHSPRPPWCPKMTEEEYQNAQIIPVFTDDPEEEKE